MDLGLDLSWRQWTRRFHTRSTTGSLASSARQRSESPEFPLRLPMDITDAPMDFSEKEDEVKVLTEPEAKPKEPKEPKEQPHENEKPPTKKDCDQILAATMPTWKKWFFLSIVFLVQFSMDFNGSIYSSAIPGIAAEFKVTAGKLQSGQVLFLIAYALGSKIWAPWSEEYGRKRVMQISLALIILSQLLCVWALSLSSVLAGRFFVGLCSAGSVPLGIVSDMWEPHNQRYAVSFIVLASAAGSIFGLIVGGYMEVRLVWNWTFLTQLYVGVVAQAAYTFFVPETPPNVLLVRKARKRGIGCEPSMIAHPELSTLRLVMKRFAKIQTRPFRMFIREPILLYLSLFSGFSNALSFAFVECFPVVFSQWGFDTIQTGFSFIPILIGYIISYLSFFPFFKRHRLLLCLRPQSLTPEYRLYWSLWTAPLAVIGLLGFSRTSWMGPHRIHWSGPMFFASLVAVASFSIHVATVDYTISIYSEYASSAVAGNIFARSFLAGISALCSTPTHRTLGNNSNISWPPMILGCLSILITIPIYVIYWKGAVIRRRSKVAYTIENRSQPTPTDRQQDLSSMVV